MESPSTTPYEQIGGDAGIRQLVNRFYDLMDTSPEAATVRRLHAASLKSSREKLYLYLTGWTGGPQLYVEKRIGLDFNHREERYTFSVAPFWRKIDYIEGEFFSQHAYGWTATFNWLFRPTFALSLSTGREHRDYSDLDRTDTDASYSMALSWRQTSHWTWALRATHALRDSTLREAGYSDNAVILSVTYTR